MVKRHKKCYRLRYYLKVFFTHLFSHVGLCGLVVGYSVIGAFLFEFLESRSAEETARPTLPREKRQEIDGFRARCLEDLWAFTMNCTVLRKANWTEQALPRLRQLEENIIGVVTSQRSNGRVEVVEWSFSSALLYSVTVITTIGYGHITPRTDGGKIMTIFYALVGVPLMLLCLTNIGQLMANTFRFTYWSCTVIWRPRRQQQTKTSVRYTQKRPSAVGEPCEVRTITAPDAVRTRKSSSVGRAAAVSAAGDPGEARTLTVLDSARSSKPSGTGRAAVVSAAEHPHLRKITREEKRLRRLATRQCSELSGTSTLLSTPSSLDSGVYSASNRFTFPEPTLRFDPAAGEDVVEVEVVKVASQRAGRVPIPLVLGFVTMYICMGAGIFAWWEEWPFLDGAYFCFITLSTIGFGDLVPGTKVLKAETQEDQLKLVFCCLYLILGLAIIAMSFSLVQEEVIVKCKEVGKCTGILYDSDAEDD
ncbi:uncharacterized protein LOC119111611 [Pollicipes pollicipes]|uniref:uncharacterized protein LOC119111611 n=1 Tax=Pollicipes pollicipes TaxID=41117 RepID=UPI0018857674|nr:uncharacterized protein LOC119111611 [Pollicipes pollicipes]